MTAEKKWYKITTNDTYENDSIKTTQLVLEFEDLANSLGESRTYARQYYTSKYSVIEVGPDSQFKLKLVFWEPACVDVYWRTQLSEFMGLILVIKRLDYRNPNPQKSEIDYAWVKANKWQKCARFSLEAYRSPTLAFEFRISLPARVKNVPTTQQILIRDLENLLTINDDSNYNVTIKSVEGEDFKVHKSILAVRCDVLKAHFEHNTKESTTSIVETQWEAKVLRDVLTFLYTGAVPGINDEPEKILVAADFYQLEGLKSLCVETMIEMLTVENAIETLQIALLHSLDTLRDQTLEFIKDGHARLITETKAWANVSNEVVKMIYEFITVDEKITYNIAEEAYEEYVQAKLQT